MMNLRNSMPDSSSGLVALPVGGGKRKAPEPPKPRPPSAVGAAVGVKGLDIGADSIRSAGRESPRSRASAAAPLPGPEFVPLLAHLGREQIVGGNVQHHGQPEELRIRHATKPGFNLGESPPADIQAVQLAASGQCLLGQIQFVAQFPDLRSYDVGRCFGSGHARVCA